MIKGVIRRKSPNGGAIWNWCWTRSSWRPRRSRQKRIGPASCSWYSKSEFLKGQPADPIGGISFERFFRGQASGIPKKFRKNGRDDCVLVREGLRFLPVSYQSLGNREGFLHA